MYFLFDSSPSDILRADDFSSLFVFLAKIPLPHMLAHRNSSPASPLLCSQSPLLHSTSTRSISIYSPCRRFVITSPSLRIVYISVACACTSLSCFFGVSCSNQKSSFLFLIYHVFLCLMSASWCCGQRDLNLRSWWIRRSSYRWGLDDVMSLSLTGDVLIA